MATNETTLTMKRMIRAIVQRQGRQGEKMGPAPKLSQTARAALSEAARAAERAVSAGPGSVARSMTGAPKNVSETFALFRAGYTVKR